MRKLWTQLRRSQRLYLIFLILCITIGTFFFIKGQGLRHSRGHAGQFDQFLRDVFTNELRCNTLNLHYTLCDPKAYGICDYEISFGDLSPKARADAQEALCDLLEELERFSYHSLSDRQQLTYDVLHSYLGSQLGLSKYELFSEPLTPNNGIQSQLPILLAEYRFSTRQDVVDYLALISTMDVYYSTLIDFEKEKAKEGLFMSDALCVEVLESCEDFLSKRDDNLLLSTFDTRIDELTELSPEEKASFKSQNRVAFCQHVIPAYELLIHQLTALLGSGQNAYGLCKYEDGDAYYARLVAATTGCEEDLDTLFSRIEAKREADLSVCRELAAQNPSVCSYSATELGLEYADESEIMLALKQAMLADFPAPPRTSCRIRFVDESLQASLAPAFYITAPIDDSSNNAIYINTAKSSMDIDYFTTLAHEGFPGHLYQNLMTCHYGQPEIRALLNCGGFTEGWATYVEMLSYYYAGLDADTATFLQHNQAAILSLYASCDIGIHHLGWEDEKIMEFWEKYGISDRETVEEIARLILADPGNYLKYYVGYLEFERLKDEMQQKYGESFSAVQFHEALLRIGPAPFQIVEKYLPSYYVQSS